MDWLPIETAPKDGTRILLCSPGMSTAFTGRWKVSKRKQGWEGSYGYLNIDFKLWLPIPVPPVN